MTIFILLRGPEMIRFVSDTFHPALALLLRRSPLLTSLAICLISAEEQYDEDDADSSDYEEEGRKDGEERGRLHPDPSSLNPNRCGPTDRPSGGLMT